MKEESSYYVYALLDTRVPGPFRYGRYTFKYKPFYIGKGTKNRCYKHIADAKKCDDALDNKNQRKALAIRGIIRNTGRDPDVCFVKQNMLEQDAFDLEMKLVQQIGRLQLKTGPLTNRSDGGEGQKNILYTDEYREAVSNRLKTFWESRTKEEVQETVEKVRKTRSNRTPEQVGREARLKSSAAKKHFASLTTEQIAARAQRYTEICVARTPEERQALSDKLSKSRIAFFDQLSDDEYNRFQRQVLKKIRARWNALTDEEREIIGGKRSDSLKAHHAQMTSKEKVVRARQISDGLQSMSATAESKRKKNINSALKQVYQERPEIVSARAAKAKATKSNWTGEQRQVQGQKISEGHAQRTPYQRRKTSKTASKSQTKRFAEESVELATSRRQKQAESLARTWASYSDEQRQQISEVHRQAHAQTSKAAKTRKANKIANSVSNRWALMTPEQRAARGDAIRAGMKKSVVNQQRYS